MKKIIIIISLFLILIAIYMKQETGESLKSQTAGYVNLFPDSFSEDKVWKINFYPGGDESKAVVLERNKSESSSWKLISYFNGKGNNDEVKKILTNLKELEGEERAFDSALFDDFKISDNEAYHLVISGKEGSDLYHLLIGKKGPDYNSGFVRFKGQSTIFMTDKNLRSTFGIYEESNTQAPDQKKWVDLNIIKVAKDDIQQLTLLKGKEKIVFSKKEREEGEEKDKKTIVEWIVGEKESEKIITKDKIDALLSSISSMRGNELSDPSKEKEYGLISPETTLEILIKDGKKHTLLLGNKKEDGNYYLKSGKGYIYLIPEYLYKNIFEKITEN